MLLKEFLRDRGRVFSTAFAASNELTLVKGLGDSLVSNNVHKFLQGHTSKKDQVSPMELRELIRNGDFVAPTSGWCPGALQANVAVLPQVHAYDFLGFCLRNQRACPLLYASHQVGSPALDQVAVGGDIRTDVPRYDVWRRGKLSSKGDKERFDVLDVWEERSDWVTFLLGCSFSFESALALAGLAPKNVQADLNVSMYRTNIPTIASGIFGGQGAPVVVSMRPYKADQVSQVIEITRRFASAHGAPIHAGDPAELGISDLLRPDYGDSPESYLETDDIPVFWCCGVTPQAALLAAGHQVDVAITHAPGHMFVTDLAS